MDEVVRLLQIELSYGGVYVKEEELVTETTGHRGQSTRK